jgi:RNA polymerase sigma-70 factor (ECF subfamily)
MTAIRGVDAVRAVRSEPLDESDLLERARSGDEAAFDELMTRYQGIALRTAYVIAGDRADAEEATQNAFTKAYFALPRFRRGATFRPWLLRIVANEARNQRRSGRRRYALALRAAVAGNPTAAAPSAEATVLAGERASALLAAINGLPEKEREVMACRHLLGLSEQETAIALGARIATVRTRRVRALKRLRAELGADDA